MRHLINKWVLTGLLITGTASALLAQPPDQYPAPQGPVTPSPIDGQWYFRGDPRKPCYVETITGANGTRLLFTNEKGSEATGQLSRNGRRITIPSWNQTGTVRGDYLVWPSGDFWSRQPQ